MKARTLLNTFVVGLVSAAIIAITLYLRGDPRRIANRLSRPVNFAHRGDSMRAPENTLESFALGLLKGAGGIEMDAHLTADGEVVVIHDPTLERTTDGCGNVSDLSLSELRTKDAGYRFTIDGRDFPYRGCGVRLTTLDEVYRMFPDARVNVEIKSRDPRASRRLMDVIVAARAEERTLVASARHSGIRRFRKVAGGRVATSASLLEIVVFYWASRFGVARFIPVRYEALQVPVRSGRFEIVTSRFIGDAHARGVAVDVWTINDPREMERLLDLGVDVVMTDTPGVLTKVLKKRGCGS